MARKKSRSTGVSRRNLKIKDVPRQDQQELTDEQLKDVVGGSMTEPRVVNPCIKTIVPCVKTTVNTKIR